MKTLNPKPLNPKPLNGRTVVIRSKQGFHTQVFPVSAEKEASNKASVALVCCLERLSPDAAVPKPRTFVPPDRVKGPLTVGM